MTNGDIIAPVLAGEVGILWDTMTITFDDPPLNEVALGRVFLPRPDFVIPYFGAFWELVRQAFPRVAHAPPIVGSGTDGVVDLLSVPLPRVWLLSDDTSQLVQLQQNRFHYNWRKASEDAKYVRFPAVLAESAKLLELFEAFVAERTGQPLQWVHSELTYVNLIEIAEQESAFEAAERMLRDSVWTGDSRFLPRPTAFGHSYSFEVPDEVGTLNVSTATAVLRDGRRVLRFELTIQSKHPELFPFEEWSLKAHDFLVNAFKDLTCSEMHKHWKLRGE